MKKQILFLLVVLLGFSMALQAQNPGNPGDRKEMRPMERLTAEQRAAKLAKELELTDAQKASVQALYEKQDEAFKKFREQTDKDSPDFRTKFRELRQAQDAELKAIIGEEKFKKLQEMRAQQRANGPGRPE